MESAAKDAIEHAMEQMWARFLPQLEARVATLESAAAALGAGTLIPAHREQASAEAHKLAGVLGSFGLHEGTSLAREAERAYAGGQPDLHAAQRMAEIAALLRAMLADRK